MSIAIPIFAVAAIVGICALLLFYPPRRAIAPHRKPDLARIAALERELGLAPPLHKHRRGHTHIANGEAVLTAQQIRDAGYDPIDVTQLGDPETRYIRGAKAR